MEFFNSSPDAAKKQIVLPLETIPVGKSIILNINEINEPSIRSSCSAYNTKNLANIRCIKHKKEGILEVANVPVDAEVMEFKFVDQSPRAAMMHDNGLKGKAVYSFEQLPEGKSIILPIEGTNEKSVRTACSAWGRRLDKKFVLIKHEVYGKYEIACLKKVTVEFFDNSTEAVAKGSELEKPENV